MQYISITLSRPFYMKIEWSYLIFYKIALYLAVLLFKECNSCQGL